MDAGEAFLSTCSALCALVTSHVSPSSFPGLMPSHLWLHSICIWSDFDLSLEVKWPTPGWFGKGDSYPSILCVSIFYRSVWCMLWLCIRTSAGLLRPPVPLADGGEAAVLQVRLLAGRKAFHEVHLLLVRESLWPSARSTLFGEANVPASVTCWHPGGVVVLQNHLNEDTLIICTVGFL